MKGLLLVGYIARSRNSVLKTQVKRYRQWQSKRSMWVVEGATKIMKTLIIIPTYNEAGNLCPLLKEIFGRVPESDILIVDDNSTDGTGELANQIHTENPQVNVIHRPGKLGLGTAYLAGFKYAIAHK